MSALDALFSVISFAPCPELDARCVAQRDQAWAHLDAVGWAQLQLPLPPLLPRECRATVRPPRAR